MPSTPMTRLYTYRNERHRYNILDYHQYQKRVAEVLSSGPHVRAALLCGGIIWRLVMECAEYHPGLLELVRSYLELGPSEERHCHSAVLQDDTGSTFVDDVLSEVELDLISGVTRVYSAL